MKHLSVALALVSCIAMPAMLRPQAGISVKGGLSSGNVSNAGGVPGGVSQRSGLAVGLDATIGNPIGLGIEALYAQRGVDGGIVSATSLYTRRLDYVDVPVYLRVSLPTPTPVSPFAYAGPQVSFEVSCDGGGAACPPGRPTTSFSGVVGAGARFASLHGITIEARYVYGLTDLKLYPASSSASYQTRSFLLLAGIGF